MKKSTRSRPKSAPPGRAKNADAPRKERKRGGGESARTSGSAASARAQARTEAILDAAEELLCTEGYAALSLRAVARALDMRVGNLQYYFPAHSDLTGALLRRSFARAQAATRTRMDADDAPLPDTLDWLLADQKNPRSVRFFYEMWAMAARNEAAAAELRAFYQSYADAVAARAPGPGALLRARLMIALLEGASLFQSGAAGQADAEFERAVKRIALELLAGERGV